MEDSFHAFSKIISVKRKNLSESELVKHSVFHTNNCYAICTIFISSFNLLINPRCSIHFSLSERGGVLPIYETFLLTLLSPLTVYKLTKEFHHQDRIQFPSCLKGTKISEFLLKDLSKKNKKMPSNHTQLFFKDCIILFKLLQ